MRSNTPIWCLSYYFCISCRVCIQYDISVKWLGGVTIGITTMSEHFGSALFVIGVIAWMLPSWTTEEQLKKATMTIIGLQAILTLVPIYHVRSRCYT